MPDIAENCCLSGGAPGSDTYWGKAAEQIGHQVIHFSFNGHKTMVSNPVILSETILATADPYCIKANETLHRRYPPKSKNVQNLLRRNWFQVEATGSLYAISHFDQADKVMALKPMAVGSSLPERTQVSGGTAWAVELFINRYNRETCECYVFDQIICYWFQWRGEWVRIYQPPKPSGIYTGIGSRKLLPIGMLAIRVLMDDRFDKPL